MIPKDVYQRVFVLFTRPDMTRAQRVKHNHRLHRRALSIGEEFSKRVRMGFLLHNIRRIFPTEILIPRKREGFDLTNDCVKSQFCSIEWEFIGSESQQEIIRSVVISIFRILLPKFTCDLYGRKTCTNMGLRIIRTLFSWEGASV
jgi:hypothetical protein